MSCWCLIVILTQDVNKGWKDGSLETKTNSSWTFFHTSNDMWKQTWNHFDGLRLFKVMVSVRSYYRGHLGLQLPQPLEPTLPRWWGEFFAFINIFILCSKQSKWWNIISKWWFSSFLCLLERTTTLRADKKLCWSSQSWLNTTRRLARESNFFELDKLLVLVLGVAVTCSQRGKCIKLQILVSGFIRILNLTGKHIVLLLSLPVATRTSLLVHLQVLLYSHSLIFVMIKDDG